MSNENFLASLDPKTRARLKLAQDVKIEKQRTASLGLNIALKGGFVYGRQHLVWGNKSAGKTSMLMQTCGLAQQEGKTVAWFDCEKTFDPAWAERLGMDSSQTIISEDISAANVTNTATDMIKAGVDILVIDSISSILPSAYWDEDELKNFEKTGQIGNFSKDVGKMSSMLMGVNKNTLLLFISQQTTEINPTYTKMGFHGGNRIKHNSSTITKLFSSESESEAIKQKIPVGDALIERTVGRPVVWNVEFNKQSERGQRGEYDFYFMGDNIGIDQYSELVKYAVLYGLIQKSGAWFAFNGEKIQGERAVSAYLRENPEVAQQLEEALYAVVL
jgi:recombination protein RecA